MSSAGSSGDVHAETLAVFDRGEDPSEPLTTPAVADTLGVARRTVYKRLEKLVDRGDLKTKKVGASARVWWQPLHESRRGAPPKDRATGENEPELSIEEVLGRVTDGFYALDDRYRFIYVNTEAETLLPLEESEVIGEDIHAELSLTEEFEAALHEAVDRQDPVFLEDYYEPLDAWFENAIYPSETGVSVYFRDISTRKQRERQLEEYRTIVETVGDGIFTVDATNHFTMVNEAYADLLEYSPDELVGMHASGVSSVEQYNEGKELKAELEAAGEVVQHELELETKTGGKVPVEARFGLLPSVEGEDPSVAVVVRDITERKERERTLQESRQRYRTLVENFPNGAVGLLDEDLRYLVLGGETFESFAPDELRDDTVYDRLPPELLEVLEPKYRAAFDGIRSDFEVEHDGRVRQFHILPMYDDAGEVHQIMGMSQDITDQKERERQLEEYRRQYRTLIENFPSGAVALVDQDFRYVAFGGTPEGDTDVTREDLEGESVREILPEQIADVVVPRYEAALDGEGSAFEESVDERSYQFHFLPVRDDDGDVFAVTAMSQDITHRKQREEALKAVNRLNEVVQDVTHGVIKSSSEAAIQQAITESLTDSDSYEFAWIGHLDRHGKKVVPQVSGPDEAGLAEVVLSAAADDPTSHGPVAEAIRSGEVQVTYDSPADPVFDRWQQQREIRHRSGISIPITFEERVYGVLNVYTAREDAFGETERQLIGGLGEVVGHALSSIERKQALLEDRVTELTFRSASLAEAYIDAIGHDSFGISIDRTVQLTDGQTMVYYSLDGLDPETFSQVVAKFYPDADCHVVDQAGAWSRVEVKTTEATLAAKLANYDSWVAGGRLERGEFRITVRVPHHSEVRTVVGAAREVYPDIEVVAQTEVRREDLRLTEVLSELESHLTDRQRTTLEVAYYSGYFDWPRTITGEELAQRLDVTQGTASHHLRHAERKLASAFFEVLG